MKSISLYVDKDTYLTRLHPFAKMLYIAAAISVPIIMAHCGCSACLSPSAWDCSSAEKS